MRVTVAACVLLLALAGCKAKTSTNSNGTSVTLTGAVRGVNPGDKPSPAPKGVSGLAGSLTVQADNAPSGCDNPTKVFFGPSTTGSGTGTLNDKRVVIQATEYSNCVLVAGNISTVTSGGGSSGTNGSTGVSGASSSPGTTVPSASPKVTKGPGPEGAIYDQTPSVPPATQK